MRFIMHVSLFLLSLVIQLDSRVKSNAYCPGAANNSTVVGLKVVEKCPTSEREWTIAAEKKQCEQLASKHMCSDAASFEYHCVINSYRNTTVEVCSPVKQILGYCTEFNDGGKIIQRQSGSECNETGFPKCPKLYLSNETFKYPDCYNLVNKTNGITISSDDKEISLIIIVGAFLLLALLCVIFLFFAIWILFIRKSKTLIIEEEQKLLKIKEKDQGKTSNVEEQKFLDIQEKEQGKTSTLEKEQSFLDIKEKDQGKTSTNDEEQKVIDIKEKDLGKQSTIKEEQKLYDIKEKEQDFHSKQRDRTEKSTEKSMDMNYQIYRYLHEPVIHEKPLKSILRKNNSLNERDSESSSGCSSTLNLKNVCFADTKGHKLEEVKVMSEPSDTPPKLSPKAMAFVIAEPFSGPRLELGFQQPAANNANLIKKLETCCVSLESVKIEGYMIHGTVKVKNLTYEKKVFLNCTFNSWATCEKMNAKFLSSHVEFDIFSFAFEAPINSDLKQQVEFAICFKAEGRKYWDNNDGKNYKIHYLDTKSLDHTEKCFSNVEDLSKVRDVGNWAQYASWNTNMFSY